LSLQFQQAQQVCDVIHVVVMMNACRIVSLFDPRLCNRQTAFVARSMITPTDLSRSNISVLRLSAGLLSSWLRLISLNKALWFDCVLFVAGADGAESQQGNGIPANIR
jgi:hypothetical protein